MAGNYEQTATGSLHMDIAATAHDLLNVSGTATLAGTLTLTLLNGYDPEPGTVFVIMNYWGLVGQFDNEPNVEFELDYGPTVLTAVAL